MKKLGTAICLSSALLASTAVQADWQGNWLVGVSGGYGVREGKEYITIINATAPFEGAETAFDQRFKDNGWLGSIFGGYQWKCNRWLLGTELNVDWRGYEDGQDFVFAEADSSLNAAFGVGPVAWIASTKYKRDWAVGLTGRMGYELAPYLMPYIRLGAEWSRDKLNFNAFRQPNVVLVGPLPPAPVAFPGISVSESSHKNSYRAVIGVGVEAPIPTVAGINGLTVRAEYDFHYRGKTVGATVAASDNLTLVNTSMNPHEQSAILSLVWNI